MSFCPAMAIGCLAGRASCAAVGRRESLAACRSQPASHAQRASWLCGPSGLSGDARVLRRSCMVARSSSEPEASFPASMSLQEAYKLLGVSESAGFDEIMAAKKRCTKQSGSDKERVVQVEAAYDILLMQSMKRRMSGDVGSAVRFADVKRARPASKAEPSLLQKLPVQVAPASQDTLLQLTAVSAALAVWSLAQGLAETPGMARNDIPGLQLALAVGATTYLLRDRKRLSLPRAGGLAVAGLVAGTLLGSALQSWLRVDIIPVFGLGSPGVFVSEWAILSLWAVGAFLA